MNPKARRIRIGGFLVPYDDAKKEVRLQRTLTDVLTATPGSDTDCMNSQCIRAQRNQRAFPHPVFAVSTIKSRVYVVDKLTKDGLAFAHAIRYELSARDSKLIGDHDRNGAGEPGELRLRIPRDPKGSPKRHTSKQAAAIERLRSYPHPRKGDGRPVTSVGAAARVKVAVGSLSEPGTP